MSLSGSTYSFTVCQFTAQTDRKARTLSTVNKTTPPTHTHTHTDGCPHLTAAFTPTQSVTLRQPRPVPFPQASLACSVLTVNVQQSLLVVEYTVKYYPDDISIVALSSLSLQVRLLPRTNHSSANRASCWRLFAGRPQDTTGVMSHICR